MSENNGRSDIEDTKRLSLSDIKREKAGIVCPKCGCKHFRTRNTWGISGAIRRIRVCRNCGWSGKSVELLDC